MLIDAVVSAPAKKDKPASAEIVRVPEILRFYTSSKMIRKGEIAELVWDVYDAHEVVLKSSDGLNKHVKADSAMRIEPRRSTFYELVAISPAGRRTDQARIRVSPYGRGTVTSPISSVELCDAVDESGANFRCIKRDGPFKAGQDINMIVRFSSLNGVHHRLGLIVREKSVFSEGKWSIVDKREQVFEKSAGRGPVEIATTIRAGNRA